MTEETTQETVAMAMEKLRDAATRANDPSVSDLARKQRWYALCQYCGFKVEKTGPDPAANREEAQREISSHVLACESHPLAAANHRVKELEAAIRKHRDERGDDKCWLSDEELYSVLPEGYTPPPRDSRVELELCQKFIACRHNPGTVYVSPQRRIEELELELKISKLEREYEKLTDADVEWMSRGHHEAHVKEIESAVEQLQEAKNKLKALTGGEQ